VCGAIDCSHEELELSRQTRSLDIFDKDEDHNFDVQAVVGTYMQFLDVFAIFPGVVHDLQVSRN
jgi:hypothetical protein